MAHLSTTEITTTDAAVPAPTCQSCGKGPEAGYLREIRSRLLDLTCGTGRYQHLDCDRF